MKKLDKLLLSSFVGPFVVAFGVALFVLIMQFLWLYIDEIAGKGVSIFILIELIAYLSVATFPMALPIAMLIASVMVLGNLSERYELSSMKSAGISLLRVMAPLIVLAAGISWFSYFCSNNLIPIANLKFKSRLYDIRKQKPALTLEPGIFNEDFRQFVIRIGGKEKDGETISDILLENMTNAGRLKFNQILADSGQMFTTADKRFFVMNLFKGTQYQEPSPAGQTQKQKYPFVRVKFQSWQKVWDLQEFEMSRTDETRFQNQRTMLTMQQLRVQLDSLNKEIVDGKSNIAKDLLAAVHRNAALLKKDSVRALTPTVDTLNPRAASATSEAMAAEKMRQRLRNIAPQTVASNAQPAVVLPRQLLEKPLQEYENFLQTFAQEDQDNLKKKAYDQFRTQVVVMENRKSAVENRRAEMAKSGYELYTKYTFALVCFIFLFIGAPMGSIIRKGGFGYPFLVAMIFFSIFITLTIACKKLAETYVLSPFWAAMTPCLILAPIAMLLTQRAINDAQILEIDRYQAAVLRVFNYFKNRKR